MKKSRGLLLCLLLTGILIGCGGLRYSQVTPGAKDFHPQRIGILPVEVGSYEEARGNVDQIIAGVLIEKNWFSDVVGGDTFTTLLGNNEVLRKLVVEYMMKLKTVNFSDPELSKKIGETAQVDAFLVAGIDYWDYMTENEKKVAKVGFAVKMINAANGDIVWKAGHHMVEDYLFMKPSLAGMAKDLIKKMIEYMPR
ncbi:MAG: hypothetical protein JXA41_05460 [Deltaproteobacteria bacterium]|nr:hypothetical protein [Deltaproteobacteria bacterium]